MLKPLTNSFFLVSTLRFASRARPKSLLTSFGQFCFGREQHAKFKSIADEEQQAIVAFNTLSFIKKAKLPDFRTNSWSLRERILNLEHLTSDLLSRAQNIKNQQNVSTNSQLNWNQFEQENSEISSAYLKLAKIGIHRKNIQSVIKAYDANQGTQINLNVWRQTRFYHALSNNKKMVLMPNLGTGQIFRKIDQQLKGVIISGEKGSGKSFAYYNYAYLSDFIINFRLSLIRQNRTPSDTFFHLVNKQEFFSVKKLFYFPLKHIEQVKSLEQQLQKQTHLLNLYKLNGTQLNDEDRIKKVRQFLLDLNIFYEKNNIETVCVADQSNAYLSAFRSVLNDKFSSHSEVERYSNIFKCVENIFSLLIYNSSQAVQAKQLHDNISYIKSKNDRKYHDPYDHNKPQIKDLHLYYNRFLSQQAGNIYMYSILWDQLCKQLTSYNIQSSKFARNIFDICFGLPSQFFDIGQNSETGQKMEMKWWNIDVRPLNINAACINHSNLTDIKKGLLLLSRKQHDETQFDKIIQDLTSGYIYIKKQIQLHAQNLCIEKIEGYLLKSPNQIVKTFRFALLQKIFQKHKDNSKLEKCQEVEVDYSELISVFQKKNPTQVYKKQVHNMCELIGSGYPVVEQVQKIQEKTTNDQIKVEKLEVAKGTIISKVKKFASKQPKQKPLNKKFKFLLSPIILQKTIAFASKSLEDVRMLLKDFTALGSIQPLIAGHFMDMLYYHLFQSPSLSLYISQLNGASRREFLISQTFPFHVRKQLVLTEQLATIMGYCLANLNKSALGFQANILEQSDNEIKKYQLNNRNPIFDFIIVKADQHQLYINSFDVSVGSIQTKVNSFKYDNQFNKLTEQITQIFSQYGKKVKWEHQILGLKKDIQVFQKINHRNINSIMFKHRLSEHQSMEEQKMKRIDASVGVLKLGICYPFHQQHFNLPNNSSHRQAAIRTQMKDLVRKIKKVQQEES